MAHAFSALFAALLLHRSLPPIVATDSGPAAVAFALPLLDVTPGKPAGRAEALAASPSTPREATCGREGDGATGLLRWAERLEESDETDGLLVLPGAFDELGRDILLSFLSSLSSLPLTLWFNELLWGSGAADARFARVQQCWSEGVNCT